jgi:cation diffusion facilitator CzcD-associated flavoprotein CzcO
VDGYLEALQKPQVSLVTDAIDHITAQGVVDAKGSLHAADVLIYATGFMPFNFLNYFSVTGPGGVQLADHWAEKVQSHRTLAVSGFPNFFMLLGPNSGLGHNSVILMIEAQVGYIVKCLQQMTRRNMPYLDPKPENQQAFNQTIQARLTGSVWDGSCSSWYKSDVGQNYTIWPFSATRYILEMRNPDFSEFNDGSNTSDQLDAAE